MKLFSVEGANQLVSQLSTHIKKLRELKTGILQKQVQIDTSLIVGGVSEPTTYAPSQSYVHKDVQELNGMVQELNAHLAEIHALGCQLKDPELGLVDFYHIRDDKIVNLCWKFGESKIEHWHDLDKGYAARQKL